MVTVWGFGALLRASRENNTTFAKFQLDPSWPSGAVDRQSLQPADLVESLVAHGIQPFVVTKTCPNSVGFVVLARYS